MKKVLLFLTLVFAFSAEAGYRYKTFTYPTMPDALKMASRAGGNVLDVCCYYPSASDVRAMQKARVKHLIVNAGHFPDSQQLRVLETLGFSYELVLKNVFPTDRQIREINASQISKLTVLSSDFPMMGEVEFSNKFKVPYRFDILKRAWPDKEHMKVIKKFDPKVVTVGFHNREVPGPGYAGFFNALKNKKVFVVVGNFPWGVDPDGFNLLENSEFEVFADERLASQDIPILNRFNKRATAIRLLYGAPFDEAFVANAKAVPAQQLIVRDGGDGSLFKSKNASRFNNSRSPIVFEFTQFH